MMNLSLVPRHTAVCSRAPTLGHIHGLAHAHAHAHVVTAQQKKGLRSSAAHSSGAKLASSAPATIYIYTGLASQLLPTS